MIDNLTIITLNQADITDFAAARNAELAKVKTEWVLFLDADEEMTPALESEIANICSLKTSLCSAYAVPRLDIFLGRELHHGETGNAKFIRLAKKDFGHWARPVHEVWEGEGKVGSLHHPLIHHSHKDIASFLQKINSYSTLDAQFRYQQGIKSSVFKIVIYPLGKFKYNYLWKLGLLDGVPGLIMAIMMSFHSYLTWSKLYLLWHKK